MTITRDHIITTARTWLGTPYHHQASTKQVGADCLGLIVGIYKELYGRTPEQLPNYSSDWAEATGIETMLEGARRHMTEVPLTEMEAGDILIFRFRADTVAKHAAIYTGQNKMIHAAERTSVCEVHMSPWWRRRIAAVFQFPGVN